MKSKLRLVPFILTFILFVACTKKKVEPKPVISDSSSTCDLISSISYSKTVVPIINSNCIACHDASTGIKLDTYDHLQPFVLSGQFIGCLNGDQNYQQMPTNSKLDSCDFKVLKIWVDEGAKNN